MMPAEMCNGEVGFYPSTTEGYYERTIRLGGTFVQPQWLVIM